METEFTQIADAQALDELVARSHEAPVVLFKHSLTCPISAAAYREMTRLGAAVSIVVIQKARDVSREVAERTGVRHESPQALVLRNGEVVWNASHGSVTADAVTDAVQQHQ